MVIDAYVITVAATILGMDPNMLLNTEERYERPIVSVKAIAMKIKSQFSDLSQLVKDIPPTLDKVLVHTKDLMMLLLLWYHYRDITREGKGMVIPSFNWHLP